MANLDEMLRWASNPKSDQHSEVAMAILGAAKGLWSGNPVVNGRGTYHNDISLPQQHARLEFMVTRSGKLNYAYASEHAKTVWVLSDNEFQLRGWSDSSPLPKKADWAAHVVDWISKVSANIDPSVELEWRRAEAQKRVNESTKNIDRLRKRLAEEEYALASAQADLAKAEAEIEGKPISQAAPVPPPSAGDKVLDQITQLLRTTATRYGIARADLDTGAATSGRYNGSSIADLAHAASELKALEKVARLYMTPAAVDAVVKEAIERAPK
jgi:hypothetical protein